MAALISARKILTGILVVIGSSNYIVVANAQPADGIKSFQADVESSNKEYREEYSRMKADSSLETLISIRSDLDSFLADANVLNTHANAAFRRCISHYRGKSSFYECTVAETAVNQSWSHFGIEATLRQLPKVSLSNIVNSDKGVVQSVTDNLLSANLVMRNMESNPELVRKCSLSLDDLKPEIDRADSLNIRAKQLGTADPILTWILANHSGLLVEDFSLKTAEYREIVEREKPQLP
jgi:hypothetical protein